MRFAYAKCVKMLAHVKTRSRFTPPTGSRSLLRDAVPGRGSHLPAWNPNRHTLRIDFACNFRSLNKSVHSYCHINACDDCAVSVAAASIGRCSCARPGHPFCRAPRLSSLEFATRSFHARFVLRLAVSFLGLPPASVTAQCRVRRVRPNGIRHHPIRMIARQHRAGKSAA